MKQNLQSSRKILLVGIAICLLINTNVLSQISSTKKFDSETVEVKKGQAKIVYSTIKLTAGELSIAGNANDLLNGIFKYNDEDYKPEIDYSESEEIGSLDVVLTKTNIDFDEEDRINWDLNLNNEVPLDLTIKLGAGQGNYILGKLNLTDLLIVGGAGDYYVDLRNSSLPRMEFKAGVGEATIDLSGERHANLDAEFTCGVGELKLYLPKNVGIRVTASGLIGSINYPGLKKKGNEYTNDLFRKTEINMDIKISGGMGEIEIKLIE